jgi:hypothetical protein
MNQQIIIKSTLTENFAQFNKNPNFTPCGNKGENQ